MPDFTLYHYWRSSSSWRVRLALEFKKIKAQMVHVGLLNGESESLEHLARHPLGYVPVLDVGTNRLIESVAIFEWLEKSYPAPALYPGDLWQQAHIRTLVEVVNSTIQPLQNLTVLDFYSEDAATRKNWIQHFIGRGLEGYEKLCLPKSGVFSVGDQITAADLFLIPQCYAAERFGVELLQFPTVEKIYRKVMTLPEAQASAPDKYEPPKT